MVYTEKKQLGGMEGRFASFVSVRPVREKGDVKRFALESYAEELKELEEAFGFAKVISLLSNSHKLVVGHNMYLDLLHVIHQFIFPLPKEYKEFKRLVQTVFPIIIDTKHMASSALLSNVVSSSTSLGDLYETLTRLNQPKLDIQHADEFVRYVDGTTYLHEAGYDAYLTGCCFLLMTTHYLKIDRFTMQSYHLLVLTPTRFTC